MNDNRIHLNEAKLAALASGKMAERMVNAGALLVRSGRLLVSRGPGKQVSVGPRGGKRVSRRRAHSAPGQPPFVQTGTLRRSIDFHIDKSNRKQPVLIFGVVKGTADTYARKLELGFARMAPRPFLRPTLKRNMNALRRILGVYK